jgi:hypothetical protein
MAHDRPLRLQLEESFRFGDGTTVLVGKLDADVQVIGRSTAQLWIDGEAGPWIRIEGERMPGPAPTKSRSVFTHQAVDVDVKNHSCVLVWTQPPNV